MVCVDCSMSMSQDSEFYRDDGASQSRRGSSNDGINAAARADDHPEQDELSPPMPLDEIKGTFHIPPCRI